MAVMPEATRVPQPDAGARLHVTPALVVSFVTVAVRVTAELPASNVVVEPDWVRLTLTAGGTGVTENMIDEVFVPSFTEVAVTSAVHNFVRVAGGV